MAEAFTMFEKFGDVCAILEEDDRKELCYAICMYGMYGEEVELPYLLKALFVSLKEDIDNSKESRRRGSQGGRPKKAQSVIETEKPPVAESEKPEVTETQEPAVIETQEPSVAETEKPEVTETKKPGVFESRKPGVFEKTQKTKTQTKPNQTNTSQTKPVCDSARAGAGSLGMLDPPTVEEVDVYAKTNCLNVDAERFVATYAAQGWLMSNGIPIRDWQAAVRKWSGNEQARRTQKEAVTDDFAEYAGAW